MEMSKTTKLILQGMAAGVGASIIQVVVGKAEEKLLPLPRHEDANLAPRLIGRLARQAGTDAPTGSRWVLGTLFHLGYGAFWGAGYALVVRDKPVPPVVGGTLLGGLIYALAFPRWGAAVLTKAERPPEKRSAKMNIVAWSVALTYGVATGLMYGWQKPGR